MATRNENPAPFMAVHPGMMIKPELEERGISQKDFAKMVGIQASHLSEVLNGKRALTTDLAVKIESAIGVCLQKCYWLHRRNMSWNLQILQATIRRKRRLPSPFLLATAVCFVS